MYLSFEDIRLDLEHNTPNEWIFDWYWSNIENDGKMINYYSYIKGLRVNDRKQ